MISCCSTVIELLDHTKVTASKLANAIYPNLNRAISAGDADNSGSSNPDARSPIIGSVMILAAQLIVACQMITEQKFISQYDVPPLQVSCYDLFNVCFFCWSF